jgi:hypothetical protein
LTLKTNTNFIASDVHGAIEPGRTMGGLRLTSEVLGTKELADIRAGNLALAVTFQLVSQDIFHNPYDQTFPLIFDRQQGGFVRTGLVSEAKPRSNRT